MAILICPMGHWFIRVGCWMPSCLSGSYQAQHWPLRELFALIAYLCCLWLSSQHSSNIKYWLLSAFSPTCPFECLTLKTFWISGTLGRRGGTLQVVQ